MLQNCSVDPDTHELLENTTVATELKAGELVQLTFTEEKDIDTARNLSVVLSLLLVLYIASSTITFCSSALTVPGSRLDSLLLTVDLSTIDTTSAMMVVTGFLCTHVYKHSTQDLAEFRRIFTFLVVDMWVSTLLSCLVGSVYLMSLQRFRIMDILLTVFEGLTSLRGVEFSQSEKTPHSLSPFSWPVLCVIIPMYLLPQTYSFNERIHLYLGSYGPYILIVTCFVWIVTLSIISSVYHHSSIFFWHASSMGYRMIEFNIGTNMFYLLHIQDPVTCAFMEWLSRYGHLLVLFMGFLWWSEFGHPWKFDQDVTCTRLYYFNACLLHSPGILARGCVLGICCVSISLQKAPISCWKSTSLDNLMILSSFVLLFSPLYMATRGILDIFFSAASVNQFSPVLALTLPALCTIMTRAYNFRVKPIVTREAGDILEELLNLLRRLFVRSSSSPPQLHSETPLETEQTSGR